MGNTVQSAERGNSCPAQCHPASACALPYRPASSWVMRFPAATFNELHSYRSFQCRRCALDTWLQRSDVILLGAIIVACAWQHETASISDYQVPAIACHVWAHSCAATPCSAWVHVGQCVCVQLLRLTHARQLGPCCCAASYLWLSGWALYRSAAGRNKQRRPHTSRTAGYGLVTAAPVRIHRHAVLTEPTHPPATSLDAQALHLMHLALLRRSITTRQARHRPFRCRALLCPGWDLSACS